MSSRQLAAAALLVVVAYLLPHFTFGKAESSAAIAGSTVGEPLSALVAFPSRCSRSHHMPLSYVQEHRR